jgi:hypothetical protein
MLFYRYLCRVEEIRQSCDIIIQVITQQRIVDCLFLGDFSCQTAEKTGLGLVVLVGFIDSILNKGLKELYFVIF